MPYQFAAAGADDITHSTLTTFNASARVGLVTGWFRQSPVATLNLWSFGTVANELFVTGTELRYRTDRATTDGIWTTSGLGWTADTWYFVAVLSSTLSTGGLQASRVWVGTIDSAPVEYPLTQVTAPVGAATGSNVFYIGNFGTSATFSFGGLIADVTVAVSSAAAGVTTNPFGIAVHGALTANEAQHVLETMVRPLWLGDTSVLFRRPGIGNLSVYHCALDAGAHVVGNTRDSATVAAITATVNGATVSQVGAPRPRLTPHMWPTPRR